MFQSWRRLLFLHWRFDPGQIQALLPAGLTVDPFDGAAWVGIVPFQMVNSRPRAAPAVPYFSNFLELNVRTYAVDEQGTPGVWFFSLSTNRLLASCLARAWFHLPYFWAAMRCRTAPDGTTDYACRRRNDPCRRTSRYRYCPTGTLAPAERGTLDFFLVERYVLFARLPSGRITTGRVWHPPYQIQPVALTTCDCVPLQIDGLPPLDPMPDHVTYSPGVDVEVFALQSAPSPGTSRDTPTGGHSGSVRQGPEENGLAF